ncbi:MAG: PAS domain-containing protein, partial [Myxococcaceae bacterium]|nr:PAS domain-containing protein [Myxococcaceae bacterium]
MIHPDDREEALEEWRNALKNRSYFSMILRFLTAGGDYQYMATRAVPVFNADGTFRQWIGTCNDITKRLRAEEALVQNQLQLQVVADTVPTVIAQLGTDLRIKFVNTGKEYFADEIGILGINQIPQQTMSAGTVGYLISGIKVAKEVAVGDTI